MNDLNWLEGRVRALELDLTYGRPAVWERVPDGWRPLAGTDPRLQQRRDGLYGVVLSKPLARINKRAAEEAVQIFRERIQELKAPEP